MTTPGGTSAITRADEFTYVVPAPTISDLYPYSGSGCGGFTVDIAGTNLSGATSVSFGGAAATIISDSSTKIVVTAPAAPSPGSGTVNVTVTTAGGTSAITGTDEFTYTACIQ